MTIILFLVDTSASMNQRVHTIQGRSTLMDIAKFAVETFVKLRQRNLESRGDRYMLCTFEESPDHIKAGWKENLTTFIRELKNLECTSRTVMGEALRQVFDLLNVNRMQSGIDTYGQGRNPFYVESTLILVITDGGLYCNSNGYVTDDLMVPLNSTVPGMTLTKEPFRWDQRIFSLVLRLPGHHSNDVNLEYVPRDDCRIDKMCEVTGGRSYSILSHRMLMQCLESLTYKIQSGVNVKFQMIPREPSSIVTAVKRDETEQLGRSKPWQMTRSFLYVPRTNPKGTTVGFWPIPESYWADSSLAALPARSSHPELYFLSKSREPIKIVENVPYDSYELESSALTHYLLSRKNSDLCWPVYIHNGSSITKLPHSFGFLKVNSQMTQVTLVILPYNYTELMPLLEDLIGNLKPSNELIKKFHSYLNTLPCYYLSLIRKLLIKLNLPGSVIHSLMPDVLTPQFNFTVISSIQKMRSQAKTYFEQLCNRIAFQRNASQPKPFSDALKSPSVEIHLKAFPKRDYVTHPTMLRTYYPTKEFLNHKILMSPNCLDRNYFKNAYVLARSELVEKVARMRSNFFQPSNCIRLVDADTLHTLPIGQMGNYQDYLRRLPAPLRPIEPQRVQRHLFGNPFKNVHSSILVDEADEEESEVQLQSLVSEIKTSRKRKPGPLSKEFNYKRQRDDIE